MVFNIVIVVVLKLTYKYYTSINVVLIVLMYN